MSYYPLFDSLSVALLTGFIIGFTSASSLLRIACLPILGSLTWHCLLTCPEYITRSSWASAVGGYTLSLFLHYIDVAVLCRWSFENWEQSTIQSASSQSGLNPLHQSEVLSRMKFGFSIIFSWRFINTPYQVRNVPLLKEELSSSKARFLTHTAFTIIVCYLLLDAMDSSSDTVPEFYSVDKIS